MYILYTCPKGIFNMIFSYFWKRIIFEIIYITEFNNIYIRNHIQRNNAKFNKIKMKNNLEKKITAQKKMPAPKEIYNLYISFEGEILY